MSDVTNLSFSMEDPAFHAFKNSVDRLTEKYAYWLSENNDVITGETPVNLHNYYIIYSSNGRAYFNVQHMESFPIQIRKDLELAFLEAYK